MVNFMLLVFYPMQTSTIEPYTNNTVLDKFLWICVVGAADY